MRSAALVLFGCALALWLAFDRVWPRLPSWIFVRAELALLVAACLAAGGAWWRERTRAALVVVGVAAGGLGLWLVVALLGLRYTP